MTSRRLGPAGTASAAASILAILCAVAVIHQFLYRALFGRGPADPHDPATLSAIPEVVSSVLVLVAVGVASARVSSGLVALWVVVAAAFATELYFVILDWARVGWGGLIGHDVWFGDAGHRFIVITQTGVIFLAYITAAGVGR